MIRVVIPTDLSDNAMHAATYAVSLLGSAEVKYTLLHAFYPTDISGPLMPSYGVELMEIAQDDMRRFRERFAAHTGIEPKVHVGYGPLTMALNDRLQDEGADLVVMGKRSGTGSAFFGSNSTDVIKRCNSAVLIVPEKVPVKPVDRILLAADHDEVLPESLGILNRIARLIDAEVLVTHIAPERVADLAHWSAGIYELALKGVRHQMIEAAGDDPAEALEHVASQYHAGMIAILHRHIGFLPRLFQPSVAKGMALHADRPLLVLEQKA